MCFRCSAYNALKNHPAVVDRIKFTQSAVITPELLKNLLDFDELYVGDAVSASDTGTFSDIWSDNVVVAYVPKAQTRSSKVLLRTCISLTH